ncbi:hypothetical protein JD969_06080 [Planctomycetota bacterium]|nr:hypothetical protein JD969_06080 [Planctomycetota bacterium]
MTHLAKRHHGKYDLVIDGLCLHCLTNPGDRQAFFKSIHDTLTPNGVAIIYTMTSPVLKKQFVQENGIIKNQTTYKPIPDADKYQNTIRLDNKQQIPIRYFEHHQTIIKHLVKNKLIPHLVRVKRPTPTKPLTHLAVAVQRADT